MKSKEVYEMMIGVDALTQQVVEKYGGFDPIERDWYVKDDNSISTRMWSILNDAHSKILKLMDEATEKEDKEYFDSLHPTDPDKIKCARCNGDGLVMSGGSEGVDPEADECPTCGGEGYVPVTCHGCTKDTSGDACAECNPMAL